MDIILLVGIIIYLIITAYTGYAAIEKLKGNELSEELFLPCLEHNSVLELFDILCSTDEIKRGKEYPDIFELAAQRLGVAPQHCLVFEDVLPAVKSAKQAGMLVCAVYDKYSAWYRVQMEKEAAGRIIDGYIVEMNSEPETEKIETKFVAQISPGNETLELFYPFVQEGEETLLPLLVSSFHGWSKFGVLW